MRIAIGTTNKGKIEAVQLACEQYDRLHGSEVVGVSVESGVADQPMSLEEIITGARNRAHSAFESSQFNLGFGLESGLFPVPLTHSGYMDTCACAIYDGTEFYVGLAPCFEYPRKLVAEVLQGKDVTEAALETGIISDREIGRVRGVMSALDKDHFTRIEYALAAIHMAMMQIESAEHYRA